MLISHQYKYVKIDIPRTGSRSYRETLKKRNAISLIGKPDDSALTYQHGTAKDAKDFIKSLGNNWEDYYSTVLVRNPWKRFASLFMWEVGRGISNYSDRFKRLEILIKVQKKQEEYFTEDGKIMVDRVGTFEDIKKEFSAFCSWVGLEGLELAHSNKSDSYDYREMYNANLIRKVEEKERYVIEKFGYKY